VTSPVSCMTPLIVQGCAILHPAFGTVRDHAPSPSLSEWRSRPGTCADSRPLRYSTSCGIAARMNRPDLGVREIRPARRAGGLPHFVKAAWDRVLAHQDAVDPRPPHVNMCMLNGLFCNDSP